MDGGVIPYLPAALAKKKENYDHRLTADPEIKCYLPGCRGLRTCPYPFKFSKAPGARDRLRVRRRVSEHLSKGSRRSPADSWMGQ